MRCQTEPGTPSRAHAHPLTRAPPGGSAEVWSLVSVLMGGAGTEPCGQLQKDDLHGVGRVMQFQDPAIAAPAAAAATTAAAAATLRQAVVSAANDRSIRRITDAVDAARVRARSPPIYTLPSACDGAKCHWKYCSVLVRR